MRRGVAALIAGSSLLLGACSVAQSATTSTTSGATSTTAPATPDRQVWLCRPGAAPDPCTAPLTATVVRGDGSTTVQPATPASHPPIDCFYVYPTVSTQPTVNANLRIEPAEVSVARAQASRYSTTCRVFAPMYRQVTVSGLFSAKRTAASGAIAYESALAGWKDYLQRYNDGRGFVLIGHSQGAFVLTKLIETQIDPDPALRTRLVSAILLGGNVLVPTGKQVGGDFHHVPACRAAAQVGCVIAYSSFDHTPPPNSLFGRTAVKGDQVLCTNPAALSGGSGQLDPYFPTHLVGITASIGALPSSTTPWVTYPDLFTGRCTTDGGATWLQVDDVRKPGDERPRLHDSLGPTWGLHLYDGNIALGNLVAIVGDEATTYGGGR